MQLFKLINTMLNHNHEAFSRNLHLLPYEVVPLSPSAGLLSWVSNTQTSAHSFLATHRLTDVLSGCKRSSKPIERGTTLKDWQSKSSHPCLA